MDRKKNLKRRTEGGVDIISNLPIEVVGHILSFLTTRKAVETGVLSRKWRYFWTHVHVLDVDNLHFPGMSNHDFKEFVDRVIRLRGLKDLEKFSLRSYGLKEGDLPRINPWIRYAAACKVKKLELYLPLGLFRSTPVRLPDLFSRCNSLVELKLDNDFVCDVPTTIPSLKLLHVVVRCPDSKFLNRLFRNSPVLEDISIGGELPYGDELEYTFEIFVPTLKRLRIELICTDFEGCSSHEFIIKTPKLEHLTIQDESFAHYVIEEIPSLVKATVGIGHTYFIRNGEISQVDAYRVMETLEAIRKARFLTLWDNTTAALGHAFDEGLPMFPSLLHLELGIDNFYRWRLLPHFLTNSPVLRFIQLDKENDAPADDPEDELVPEEDWIAPESTPYCLLWSLKEIKMRYLWGSEDEEEVVRYLLQNSRVLEKMSITFSENALKEELDENMIESFPRGSTKCELKFV